MNAARLIVFTLVAAVCITFLFVDYGPRGGVLGLLVALLGFCVGYWERDREDEL